MLDTAFSEIDAFRHALPEKALNVLAQEVVGRVARKLVVPVLPDFGPDAGDIDRLCDALLSEDTNAAATFIENLRMKGSSYETVCLAYLAAAARRLGQRWDDDEITFYRVSVGAGRIYAILRVLRLARTVPVPDMVRAATFASVPGETHTLGITMATDLARDRGWDIELFLGLSHDALVEQLEQRQPALICFSASGKRSLPALTRLIVALRISNPHSHILLCGQISDTQLSLVGMTGADAVAHDFEEAIVQMGRLLELRHTA
jgi:methanogenic corrinoid protein MtbC1